MYVDSRKATDPASGPGVVQIVAGEGIEVDNSDPSSPRVAATGSGGSFAPLPVDSSLSWLNIEGAYGFVDSTGTRGVILSVNGTELGDAAGGSGIAISHDDSTGIPKIQLVGSKPVGLTSNADVVGNLDPVQAPGSIIYDTTSKQLMFSDGVSWAPAIVVAAQDAFGVTLDVDTLRAQLTASSDSFLQLTGGSGVFVESGAGAFYVDSPFPSKLGYAVTIADFAAADYEGYQIYDTVSHSLKYSNGTDWVAVGGGGGVQSVSTDGEPIEINNGDPANPLVEFNRHNAFYIVHGNPPSPVGWLGQVMYFASDVAAGWTPGLHLSDNTQWLLIAAAVDPG